MPPLFQLPKLDSINGAKSEKSRRLQDVEAPRKTRDVTNKKYVDERGTFVSTGDAVSNGHIILKDEGGADRKVMIKA